VILRDNGPSIDADNIEFMPNALKGLAELSKQGFACMVATNQPWIARGLLTPEQLAAAHLAMASTIEQAGGKLIDIVHSPYHPETHHGEGIADLRRSSECRKPRAGMLFDLMERHGYDPSETVMIGDSKADIVAGKNAGTRSILIGTNPGAEEAEPDAVCSDLVAAAAMLESWNQSL
jgi:D-glycero-D-manno-heptose 1,7-bisphosphate phosphatase